MRLRPLLFATALTFAATAWASVTIDANGVGFVGKGDVQLAFGWNNATLQANAAGVSFKYESTEVYTATCTFVTGEGTRGEKTHVVTRTVSADLTAAIASEARRQQQVTGFNLLGWSGSPTATGEVPVNGAPCHPDAGKNGPSAWSDVSSVGSSGGLYVSFDGTSILLQ